MKKSIILLLISACSQNNLYSSICDEPCWTGTEKTKNVGVCHTGVPVCDEAKQTVISCQDEQLPTEESCDGLDNDCDGYTDDNVHLSDPVTCGSNLGQCRFGITRCIQGILLCEGGVQPEPESCDGLDNNCDGATDNLDPEFCYTGQMNELMFPPCRPGIYRCESDELVCLGQQTPQSESCDDLDNDCDGLVDESSEDTETDIVFILDRSGSMAVWDTCHLDDCELRYTNIIQAIENFVGILSYDSDYLFALLYLPGQPVESEAIVAQDFSDGLTTLVSLQDPMPIYGGIEATVNVLAELPELVNFRPGSTRVVIMFTDEPIQPCLDGWPQPPDCNNLQVSTEEAVEILVEYNISVFVFTTPQTDFTEIATSSGGGINTISTTDSMETQLVNLFSRCE